MCAICLPEVRWEISVPGSDHMERNYSPQMRRRHLPSVSIKAIVTTDNSRNIKLAVVI